MSFCISGAERRTLVKFQKDGCDVEKCSMVGRGNARGRGREAGVGGGWWVVVGGGEERVQKNNEFSFLIL